MSGVPHGGVDAVSVLLESPHASISIHGPELHCIIPGSRQERIFPNSIVVNAMDFSGVLLEGADGVVGGRQSEVVELDGAVGYGGDD